MPPSLTREPLLTPKKNKVLVEGMQASEDKNLEQHLVVAKMNWANAELKVDLLKEEVKSLK